MAQSVLLQYVNTRFRKSLSIMSGIVNQFSVEMRGWQTTFYMLNFHLFTSVMAKVALKLASCLTFTNRFPVKRHYAVTEVDTFIVFTEAELHSCSQRFNQPVPG